VPKTLWRKWLLERLSGTHLVPVVRTPDRRLLWDSTPIITHLDACGGAALLHGEGTRGVLVRVIEEWLDEWLPRVVLHYRWNHPECAVHAGAALAREVLPVGPSGVRRAIGRSIQTWGLKACRALGVDTPQQQAAAEAEARRIFEALEEQLGQTRFALGDRPTAVDATLLGGLRAHFLTDPVPRRLLESFPRVVAWATDTPRATPEGDLPTFPETTAFGRFVLAEFAGPYRRVVLANAHALTSGDKSFTTEVYGQAQSYLTRPYPERSRQMVIEVIAGLDAQRQADVLSWLDTHGLQEVFRA
jgi:glutathione S-transferase